MCWRFLGVHSACLGGVIVACEVAFRLTFGLWDELSGDRLLLSVLLPLTTSHSSVGGAATPAVVSRVG
jgi:hypothetical protein